MMKIYNESIETNHNPHWPYISYHPFRILIIGGSGSSKTNVSLLIKYQRSDIEKIDLCVKYLLELKHQWFINGRENIGIKNIVRHSLITYKQLMVFMKTIIQLRRL